VVAVMAFSFDRTSDRYPSIGADCVNYEDWTCCTRWVQDGKKSSRYDWIMALNPRQRDLADVGPTDPETDPRRAFESFSVPVEQ
jgi:hypothetical protein